MSLLDSNEFVLDEPSERVKRAAPQNMDLVLPDSKRRALPTQLNQLDDLTLGNIVDVLKAKELLLLMLTGNWFLTAKIKSQLKSLDFNRHTLSPILKPRRKTRLWGWPDLLTQQLPHLTRLNIDYVLGSKVAVRLDLLPPALTGLALSNGVMCFKSLQHVIFTLPLLQDLTISSLSANQVGNALQLAITDDQWLIPSIANSPLLTRVIYQRPRHATIHSLKTIASLANLEVLGIDRLLIDECNWPSHLHTLQLFSEEKMASMPSTLTRLQLPHLHTRVGEILSMVPDTLLHFEMPVLDTVWPDALVQNICRFHHLQTLNLILDSELNDGIFSAGDLSNLPKTINLISFPFALIASRWQYLPPNVKFVADNRQRWSRNLPCYNAVTDVDHLPYFPKNLHEIALYDCLVPMAMPYLTRIHFDITTMELTTEFAHLLDNLPPILTMLTARSEVSLVPFGTIDTAKRFPYLTTLWLDVMFISGQDVIIPWLNTLPRSLTLLGLNVEHVEEEAVDLSNVVFPPNLLQLSLTIENALIGLPKTLPETLYSVEIQGEFIGCHHHIERWPVGLRRFTVASMSTHPEVRNNHRTKTDGAKDVLLRRILEKTGRPVRLYDAVPLRYE